MRSRVCSLLFFLLVSCGLLEAAEYQNVTLMSVKTVLHEQHSEVTHENLLNSIVLNSTTLVYHFKIRSGRDIYTAEYTPDTQNEEMPKEWPRHISVQIKGHRILMKGPDNIVRQARIIQHSQVHN